jgi:DNA-binding SARP family transcriptional activator/predicted Ser/Thr protein kinase
MIQHPRTTPGREPQALLRLLGQPEVRAPNATHLSLQPKRLGLLAYLAAITPRGARRRDTLLGVFWPEQDRDGARGALRQALRGLRRALPAGVIVTRADDVELDRERLACDVWTFEDAVGRGELEAAVASYGGPFLQGFFLHDCPEFERWVDAERDRLARLYRLALEALAHGAGESGDRLAAVVWWRRVSEQEPFNTRVTVRLMQALEAAGDRAGALQHAELHAARLRDELGAEPAPDVVALADRLRAHPPGHPSLPSHSGSGSAATTPRERFEAVIAGRYRVLRRLGRGGMASVYLARDLKHEREVALKLLRPDLAAVIGAERFLAEIRTTANLQHPHIVPLHDSGEVDGSAFYVMPFIDGESLRERLRREKMLPVAEALRIAAEIAAALDYAHRKGVIHRDIKPENVLLHDGQALVVDFGIALAVSTAGAERLTEAGVSLGTPQYMAPEQAMGDLDIDARIDVYALGCVVYEMLTGEPPFVGSTAQAILAKVLATVPEPATTVRKTVPPHVAAAVAKALEKLPADRFLSAGNFAQALTDARFSVDGATLAAVSARARRQRHLTFTLGSIALAMTLVAAWALLRPRPEPRVIRYALALPEDRVPARDGFVTGTSDGSRLIYLGPLGSSGGKLWMKERHRLEPVPLAGTDGATSAAVSPDDRWLAFVRGTELLTMPLSGGPAATLARDVSIYPGAVTWLDQGNLVYAKLDASGSPRALERIGRGGGAPVRIWSSDTLLATMLTALPHARGVLFQGCLAPCAPQSAALWALDLRTHAAHVVQPGGRVGYVVGDDRLISVGREQVTMVRPFDLASLRVTGSPNVVTDTVSGGEIAPYFWVARNGSTLAMQRGAGVSAAICQFVWVDRKGQITPLDTTDRFRVTQTAGNFGWSLSPDGSRVAIGLNTASGDDIWIISLLRGAMWKAATRPAADYRPHWRPDGEHITFLSDSGVFIAHAGGGGNDSLVWPGVFDEGVLSPDGRWVLVRMAATGPSPGGRDILGARLGLDTALRPIVATPSDEMAINLSPDGRWLAYQSDETARLEVYVRPFPGSIGGRIQISAGGGSAPIWSPDGRTLYYLRDDQVMMAVKWPLPGDRRIEAREIFRLTEPLSAFVNSRFYTPWDVAADGRFLMVQIVAGAAGAAGGNRPLVVIENWDRETRRLKDQ